MVTKNTSGQNTFNNFDPQKVIEDLEKAKAQIQKLIDGIKKAFEKNETS